MQSMRCGCGCRSPLARYHPQASAPRARRGVVRKIERQQWRLVAGALTNRVGLLNLRRRDLMAAHVVGGKVAECIVQKRCCRVYGRIAIDRPSRTEPGEREGFNKSLQGHPMLQANADGMRKIVHQPAKCRALLVQGNEDLTQRSVAILACPQE